MALNLIALIATFYTSLYPVGGSPDAEAFFESYLAGPIILALYLGWKLYSRDWSLYVKTKDMDVTTGIRRGSIEVAQEMRVEGKQGGFKKALRAFF